MKSFVIGFTLIVITVLLTIIFNVTNVVPGSFLHFIIASVAFASLIIGIWFIYGWFDSNYFPKKGGQ